MAFTNWTLSLTDRHTLRRRLDPSSASTAFIPCVSKEESANWQSRA
jgi:hypothetical protein